MSISENGADGRKTRRFFSGKILKRRQKCREPSMSADLGGRMREKEGGFGGFFLA